LSSNWKRLQKSLKSSKTLETSSKPITHGTSIPLKRKQSNGQLPPKTTHNGLKRPRLTPKPSIPTSKPRKMGILSSKPLRTPSASITTSQQPPSATLALFAEDHDLNPADVAAAYSIPPTSISIPTSTAPPEVPNSGLNTTVQIGKYVALDCEMVGTGPPPSTDSQLARVSLVNYHGVQIYDSYVAPTIRVTDYRTHVSGITEELLKAARPFKSVRRDVEALLENRILVGHAIKNDLEALQLKHPPRDIRDTSRYAEFRKLSRGRTPALKRLAKELLGVEIQGGEHSSLEDARATMLLFRREKDGFEREVSKRY
ncbi:hypothetical protein M501DRAFT_921535, partial [Patellaria atrata CBS 101060]